MAGDHFIKQADIIRKPWIWEGSNIRLKWYLKDIEIKVILFALFAKVCKSHAELEKDVWKICFNLAWH